MKAISDDVDYGVPFNIESDAQVTTTKHRYNVGS